MVLVSWEILVTIYKSSNAGQFLRQELKKKRVVGIQILGLMLFKNKVSPCRQPTFKPIINHNINWLIWKLFRPRYSHNNRPSRCFYSIPGSIPRAMRFFSMVHLRFYQGPITQTILSAVFPHFNWHITISNRYWRIE